jgi:hypothetical protein
MKPGAGFAAGMVNPEYNSITIQITMKEIRRGLTDFSGLAGAVVAVKLLAGWWGDGR